MQRFFTILKVIFICFTFTGGMLMLAHIANQYASEGMKRNLFVDILCNGSEIYQVMLLCLFGHILCRNEVKKHGVTPAVYPNVITQFVKQYGTMVLLLGAFVMLYPDSDFSHAHRSDYRWMIIVGEPEWNFFNVVKSVLNYSIEPFQIFAYWLMYVTYVITKSYYQVKQRKSVQVSSD